MNTRQPKSATLQSNVQTRRVGLLGLAVVMASGLLLSACNTTEGAGRDVSATGNAVTRGAAEVKSKL